MCDNNMTKCECNQKELCEKMLKASIRKLISGLRCNKSNSNTIRNILLGIEMTLGEYKECIPCVTLQNRARWTRGDIICGCGSLYSSEEVLVDSYIAELEVFVNN